MTQPDMKNLSTSVIQDLIQLTRQKYVYPDIGEQIADHLQANLNAGMYDSCSTPGELAASVTMDLQEISQDHHWAVVHDPAGAAALIDPEEEKDAGHMQRYLEAARKNNFGFQRLERMKGNIGYLELHGFHPAEHAGETVAAAMNFLANCDALILDIRKCRGGYPSTVQLLLSYLLDEKPRHINTFYYRPTDDTQQFWTFPHVPGRRRPDMPVYVLTSRETGSGGEEIAYDLKHLERATLIGETTVGAAHPVTREVVQGIFVVRLPYGRPINPVTGTNWEGTGVEPHISVPAAEALKTAHLKAIETLLNQGLEGEALYQMQWVAEIVESLYNPVDLPEEELAMFAGEYGKRIFLLKDGQLHAGHHEFPVSWLLVPMSATRFRLDEDMKFEFILDESGQAVEVRVTYKDGRPEAVSPRNV